MGFRETAKAIKALRIQGAQSIALAGVKSLVSCRNKEELREAVKLLNKARPTEPCLRNALRYVTKAHTQAELKQRIEYVESYFNEAGRKIVEYGSRRLKKGYVVFTHCHSSTVVNILLKARGIEVHNTETRPFFQGRITAWELAKAGIRVTHYVDSAARLALKRADIMLIGCDVLTSDGFVVNKIGSEMFAEIADSYNIPVYVCTLSWKFDPRTKLGFNETLESRFKREVWANPPKNVRISNIVFEKIHPRLITGIISEFGITTVEGFLEAVKSTFEWMR